MFDVLEQEVTEKLLRCRQLNGYDNANYLLETDQGKCILKSYKYSLNQKDLIEAENKILTELNSKIKGCFPQPIRFRDNSYVKKVTNQGQAELIRMLNYLDGVFLGDTEPSRELYQSLGIFLAEMDLALQAIDSYVIKSKEDLWDLQYFHLNEKYIDDIPQARDRAVVRYFFEQFDLNIRPLFPHLRKQLIHNDANEWNVLVQDGKISGLIDFGDLAHSYLINEVAIAITYSSYDKENPLDYAELILHAYHEVLPLQEEEVDALYYLIAARLCTSICNSSHSKKINPENKYASVSEKFALQMLHKWIAINPVHAKNRFRKAIGLEPILSPSIDDIIHRRNNHISTILSLSYKEPIHMVGAAFQYMYGADGATYLDAYNNIPHVGHCHPRVTRAGSTQMYALNTNTRYLYDELAEYSEKLLSKFPDSLSKVFFVNSGSAASDLAIRMARKHTGYEQIMVMELGYHGNTQTSIDISDYKFNNPKGDGQKEYILKTPVPNIYNGKYTSEMENPGLLYARDTKAQLEQNGKPIAAFVAEPILGCAGQVPLAPEYLKEVYPAIRKQGGICISDEVQTGFGRVGEYFWGYEAHGVIPDLVILGKPIANGHPMGAVVTTDEIAQSFEQGVEFFSSFGGNPVSCAIGATVLEVIEEEGLQENAKLVGLYYMSLLKELMQKYSCIGDVRGMGLFIGVELVIPNSREPNTALAQLIKNQFRKNNILISTDGPFDNVIKSKPPLCFTKKNAKTVVDLLESLLNKYSQVIDQ